MKPHSKCVEMEDSEYSNTNRAKREKNRIQRTRAIIKHKGAEALSGLYHQPLTRS